MIREFLICLAIFDIMYENNFQSYPNFLPNLNPYYYKIRKSSEVRNG